MSILDIVSSFQQSSPIDVEGLIRALGIPLEKTIDLPDEVLGLVVPNGDGELKIIVSKKGHYFRQRFTMAHELGHVLMHRDLLAKGTNDTAAFRSTNTAAFYNPLILPSHETQANRFAANLLMPADLIRSEWPLHDPRLKEMAKAFQVSPAAMKIRLQGIFGMNVYLVDE